MLKVFLALLSFFLSSCDWTSGLLLCEQEAAAGASKGTRVSFPFSPGPSAWSCACQHQGDHMNVTVRSWCVSSDRRTCFFPEVLLSMVSPMRSFRKGFQTHIPKKEKGSFERWDLKRGSDSWAQREMGREWQPAEAAEAIPNCAESWEWGWGRSLRLGKLSFRSSYSPTLASWAWDFWCVPAQPALRRSNGPGCTMPVPWRWP